MTSFLVTGGAGFIGSHIVEQLARRGDVVTVIDDFSTGRRENIAHLLDGIKLVSGSVCDDEIVREGLRNVEVVLHLAAIPSVTKSVEDPLRTNHVNVEGTLKLLRAARECGVKRVVFASSSSIYGDSPVLPKNENMLPEPISPYGASKLAAELYAFSFWKLFGLETVRLRLFNVFGPRQDPNSQYAAAIPRFIAAIKAGRKPTVYGDGEQSRDFTYVGNVVDAFLRAAAAPGVGGKVMNIACGTPVSVKRMAHTIGKIMKKSFEIEFAPPRPGDIRHSYADIAAAKSMLNYEPRVGLEEGLSRTIADCAPIC